MTIFYIPDFMFFMYVKLTAYEGYKTAESYHRESTTFKELISDLQHIKYSNQMFWFKVNYSGHCLL